MAKPKKPAKTFKERFFKRIKVPKKMRTVADIRRVDKARKARNVAKVSIPYATVLQNVETAVQEILKGKK